MLYSACKTSADVCQEKGYTSTSCNETDDSADCPENNNFKRCTINCFKHARATNPDADVIGENITDPVIDVTKTQMRSLVGMTLPQCLNKTRPEVTLHLNTKNMDMYDGIFDREIENINFNLIFEEPLTLSLSGALKNVKITVSGTLAECPLKAGDGILLCSDGLSNMVTDKEMYECFLNNGSPEEVCTKLMALALDRGARDNVTVVLVKI